VGSPAALEVHVRRDLVEAVRIEELAARLRADLAVAVLGDEAVVGPELAAHVFEVHVLVPRAVVGELIAGHRVAVGESALGERATRGWLRGRPRAQRLQPESMVVVRQPRGISARNAVVRAAVERAIGEERAQRELLARLPTPAREARR